MSKVKNMFEQLSVVELQALGQLVGAGDTYNATFRNACRDVPPLKEGWTLGKAANAFLLARLAYVNQC